MSKKTYKILSTILLITMMISLTTSVFALSPGNITGSNSVNGSTQIESVGKDIVGILQTIGIVLSVVVLIVLGIKYMMGSAEEKADYKKSMLPYLVGAIVIFAASAFAEVIYNFAIGISSSGN